MRCIRRVLAGIVVLLAMIWTLYLMPLGSPRTGPVASPHIAPFSHVFVIMMENQGSSELLGNPNAPYINQLARQYGTETDYFGVTHPSLPNYVALIAGSSFGSHSDSPLQRFSGTTLVDQLAAHHITWQAAMQSLPYPGYLGNWYPGASSGTTMPPTALYAKKHDPFVLFPHDLSVARSHVVPLRTLGQELSTGRVPQFVWITPDVCHDMHGQPSGPGASCPTRNNPALIRQGDQFLSQWVPRILDSSAWSGNAALFIVWDESNAPATWTPSAARSYLAAGPQAPPLLNQAPWLGTVGGGAVPLIVIAREGRHPLSVSVWSDHFSLLKTWEASWQLGYLGAAASPKVPLLSPFFTGAGGNSTASP